MRPSFDNTQSHFPYLLLLAVRLWTIPHCSFAVTNWVSGSGSDVTGDGSESNPYRTITKALQTPNIDWIWVGAGTYNANAGETLPLVIPSGVSVVGTGDPSLAVIDGGYTNQCVTLGPGSATNLFKNLSIIRAKGTAIVGDQWRGTIENVIISDIANGNAVNNTSCFYYSNGVSCALTLSGVVVSNVSCNVQKFFFIRGTGSLLITNCTFKALTTTVAPGQANGTFSFFHPSSVYTPGFYTVLADCLFEDVTVPGYAGNEGGIISAASSQLILERCKFLNITVIGANGTMLYCPNRIGAATNAQVRDCLFYNINCGPTGSTYSAAIGGFRSVVAVRNCTFYNVTSVFRPNPDGVGNNMYAYNSILSSCGLVSQPTYPEKLFLYNVNTNDTSIGAGYNSAASSNVTAYTPYFLNAAGTNLHLHSYSPLVDAGRTSYVQTTMDLDKTARIRDGNGDGFAEVDLGCYELNFADPDQPRFLTPGPVCHAFGGQTLNVPIWIQPPPGGTATGAVSYGQDLSGPQTLTFITGSETNTLYITVTNPLTVPNNTLSPVLVSETNSSLGVEAGEFGVYLHDPIVTVPGHVPRLFIRPNVTNTYRVQLEDSNLQASAAITISTGGVSGAGNNAIVWLGGNTIPAGGWQSEGYLQIVGGSGKNFVTISVNNDFVFSESMASSLLFEVIGFTSPLYVATTGSDSNGSGAPSSPLRTIQYAADKLVPGEEIRLEVGTYGSGTGEKFPITIPEGISIVGIKGTNCDSSDSSVIDANGSGIIFMLGTLGSDPGIRGSGGLYDLVLTRAKGTFIRARYWGGAFSNCLIHTIINGGAVDDTAVIRVEDSATMRTVIVSRVVVSNVAATTSRLLYFEGNSGTGGKAYLRNCAFLDCSTTATPGGGYGIFSFRDFALDMTDCIFANLIFPGNDNRETGMLLVYNRPATIDRCIFRDLTVSSSHQIIVGMNRSSPAVIANSLLHNIACGTNRAAVSGFRTTIQVKSCAIDGATCAFRVPEDSSQKMYVYNTSVSWCGSLNSEPNTNSFKLFLTNVNIYSTPLGFGYIESDSTNVTFYDPLYMDRSGGNYRLRPSSPLVNAGDTNLTQGTLDLDLSPRIKPPGGVVDIGPYELEAVKGTVFVLR